MVAPAPEQTVVADVAPVAETWSPPPAGHRLLVNTYMMCEYPEGRVRCRGLDPIGEGDAWTFYVERMSRVSLAGMNVCGLREGRVHCWGEDFETADGDYDLMHQTTCSTQAFFGLTGVRELAMTEAGGCVITAEGVVRCWGEPLASDDYDDLSLYDVLRDAHGLAVGMMSGCALTPSGIRCWGDPLGRPDDADPLPTAATYGVEVPDPVQVVVGDDFACARSADGRVFCWGYDLLGVVGPENEESTSYRPRIIPNLRATDLIAFESGVCARSSDAKTHCWGPNHAAQLGLGHTRHVDVPTHVPWLDGAEDVALGPDMICGRFADGATRCAGDLGPISSNLYADAMPPQRMPGGVATRLLVGADMACVGTVEGIRCHGEGGRGRRGMEEAASGFALDVEDQANLVSVRNTGIGARCYRWRDGRVRCEARGTEPVVLARVRALATYSDQVCVIDAGRKVQCFVHRGANARPTEVPGVAGVASIALASGRGCAVTTAGRLSCFSTQPRTAASQPNTTLRDFRAVALAGDRTCALRRGGQVMCWQDTKLLRGDIAGVTAIDSGGEMCVVIAGAVRCLEFGRDAVGLRAPLEDVTNVVELASGGNHQCARTEAGAAYCWGTNDRGQLGVLPPSLRLTATEISGDESAPEHAASLECRGTSVDDEDESYDDDGEEEMYDDGPI